jgi:hypothetical protein
MPMFRVIAPVGFGVSQGETTNPLKEEIRGVCVADGRREKYALQLQILKKYKKHYLFG